MAKASVIARATGQPGAGLPLSTSTDEFQFLDGAATAALAKVQVNGRDLVNKQFKVRAGGRVVGGTTTNFTANLDFGVSTTIGSNTTIGTTGALAVNSESGFWLIEANLVLTPLSATVGKLQGWYTAYANDGTLVSPVKITEVTSVDTTGTVGFNCTGTFSSGNANNSAILDFLEIEL